jgi:transcription antitermination factor NusG
VPILDQEPDLFPDDLLQILEPDSNPGTWHVMYTLSRREKDLMRKLRAQEIPHYGPMVQQRKRSPAGRIRTSYIPLFTGYVFVCGDEEARYTAVSTGCVSRNLSVTENSELLTDLRRIHLLQHSGTDVRPEPKPLVGRTARVISGPMAGVKGTISQEHSHHRLTVIVKFMNQGASVQVDEADLELLD